MLCEFIYDVAKSIFSCPLIDKTAAIRMKTEYKGVQTQNQECDNVTQRRTCNNPCVRVHVSHFSGIMVLLTDLSWGWGLLYFVKYESCNIVDADVIPVLTKPG